MQKILIIIVLFFIAFYFYVKKTLKAFKIDLLKISALSIKKNHLQGIVLLQITNKYLPFFDIKKTKLNLYVNNVFIAPIENFVYLKNGFVKLKIDANLKKVLTVENLIYTLQGNSVITIQGSIEVKKGLVNYKIPVNENIKI
jgi:LEA14-like dessication related protein